MEVEKVCNHDCTKQREQHNGNTYDITLVDFWTKIDVITFIVTTWLLVHTDL